MWPTDETILLWAIIWILAYRIMYNEWLIFADILEPYRDRIESEPYRDRIESEPYRDGRSGQ